MQFKLVNVKRIKFSKRVFNDAIVKGNVVIDYPSKAFSIYNGKISGAYIYLYGKYWHCPYIYKGHPSLFTNRYFDWFEITPNEIINVTYNISVTKG